MSGEAGHNFYRKEGVMRVLVALVCFLWATLAHANSASDLVAQAAPPIGYIEFCDRVPDQCVVKGSSEPIAMNEGRWQEVEKINTFVNQNIIPATDQEFYQQEEYWALPEIAGDCEDYVLLKRKLLLEKGWSSGALLIAVVWDEMSEGHAVLLVRTSAGTFILDNKTNHLVTLESTQYKVMKWQWKGNPNLWLRREET